MDEQTLFNEINRLAREMATIRQLVTQVVTYIREAESEIPEKMRRFMNYFHDVRDIRFMQEETGQPVPPWIDREIERLFDRYRQLLELQNTEGGAFAKVRAEMASDPLNRYDHTRLLTKEKLNETGQSEQRRG